MSNGTTTKKSFASSAKEAAVITFSILIAFSLDAWWEGVQVERDVQDILQAIEIELEGNLASLGTSSERHLAISDAISALLKDRASDGFEMEAFSGAVIELEVFEPVTGAVDTLVATGLLSEVGDADLRLLLGSYAALLQDLNEQETRAVEFRDAARRRIASLGIRIWDVEARGNATSDIEMLNLLLMRQVEENNAIASASALDAHIRKILIPLKDSL